MRDYAQLKCKPKHPKVVLLFFRVTSTPTVVCAKQNLLEHVLRAHVSHYALCGFGGQRVSVSETAKNRQVAAP
jgi:hypothetical protein